MAPQPTPKQATEALRNVDQRTAQAVGVLRGGPRWLDVFFGLGFLLYGASNRVVAVTERVPVSSV